ncbi:MAG: clostripain-related cysteine peptidase [Bacteroidales bacterium]
MKTKSIKRRMYTWYILLSMFTLVSCTVKEDDIPQIDNNRSVLVYLLGNNSLSSNANMDLLELENAAKNNDFKGTLLCFLDDSQPGATLFQLDRSGKKVIKEYPSGYKTATPEAIKDVMATMKSAYPAPSYGLVLWSHGSGWLPSWQAKYNSSTLKQNYPLVKSDKSKAFGQDGVSWMELKDIKASLKDKELDFLIFDACYMGQVEVLYELKEKAKYIIASPAEILADGFPYDKVAPLFFEKTPAIKDITSTFFEYYNAKTGVDKSATISAIDTKYLTQLGDMVKGVYATRKTQLANLPLQSMQCFDRNSRHTMFDLGQIIREIAPDRYTEFSNLMKQAVVYKNFTPIMFDSFIINDTNYCGLSSYIPSVNYSDLNPKYIETDWGKYVLGN